MRYRIVDGELVKTPAEEAAEPSSFSRRRFLGASFFAIGAATLSACSGSRNCDANGQNCTSGGGGFIGGGGG